MSFRFLLSVRRRDIPLAIIFEKHGKMAHIAINRPEVMNAIDIKASKELSEAWLDFRDNPEIYG